MGTVIGPIVAKTILPETSSHSPTIAFFEGRLFIAWKGSGNDNLNILCSQQLSASTMITSFDSRKKHISGETSDNAPTLTVHRGGLFIAWKGSGNDNLNVGLVDFIDRGGEDFDIRGIVNKMILRDTSNEAPALASHDNNLFIAWKGSGNDNLNLMYSQLFSPDTKQIGDFRTDLKHISQETSDEAPALASHRGKLFIGWKGSGNDALNSAEVQLSPNPDGPRIAVFGPKQILPTGDPDHLHVASSNHGPAMLSHGQREGVQSSLFMAWRDNFQDLDGKLGIAASDSGLDFSSSHFDPQSPETSDTAPALSSSGPGPFNAPGILFIAWKGAGNDNLNVAAVAAGVT